MIPAGFKPPIPASEQRQTHALDRAATGIGDISCIRNVFPLIHASGSSRRSMLGTFDPFVRSNPTRGSKSRIVIN